MNVPEPLPRVYLDTIQEMLVIKHYLTPCCRDVVPFLPLDRPPNMHHDYSTVLSFHEQIAVPLVPYTLDVVCGRLSLRVLTHPRQT